MSKPVHGNTESFIVRIWFEETDDECGAFVRRGSIEHVRTKKRLFFCELEPILNFIDEQSGPLGSNRSPQADKDSGHLGRRAETPGYDV